MNIEIESHEYQPQYNGKIINTTLPIYDLNLTYAEFFQNHLLENVPCIIKDVARNWESYLKWVDGYGPRREYLKCKYGELDVTIYNCDEQYFNSHKTETVKFETFLKDWNSPDKAHYYLKDWHLRNLCDDDFYEVPQYFASDWLNEYLVETGQDDYRFVYMGRSKTWTPFHSDVFNSYSWSVNVCGKKRWLLFPPGEEHNLKDNSNNFIFDISNEYGDKTFFEVIQNEGEGIFVPSGWYHQVWNLEDTISINHNWINGCNILQVWNCMENNLENVKEEIKDCMEMSGFLEHCQLMLKSVFGMDMVQFYKFLKYIAIKRLEMLIDDSISMFNDYKLGTNHVIFDLKSIQTVLKRLLQHVDIDILFVDEHPRELHEKIGTVLNKLTS